MNVRGEASICDCQPERVVGTLGKQPFDELRNGRAMVDHRAAMLGEEPPEACAMCSRF